MKTVIVELDDGDIEIVIHFAGNQVFDLLIEKYNEPVLEKGTVVNRKVVNRLINQYLGYEIIIPDIKMFNDIYENKKV